MISLKYASAIVIGSSIGALPFILIFALIMYWLLNLFFSHGLDKTEVLIKTKKLNAFISSCGAGVVTAYMSALGGRPFFSGSSSDIFIFTGHVLAIFFLPS